MKTCFFQDFTEIQNGLSKNCPSSFVENVILWNLPFRIFKICRIGLYNEHYTIFIFRYPEVFINTDIAIIC